MFVRFLFAIIERVSCFWGLTEMVLKVTQAALLKRRTGQDELRATPDSDSVDDAGSM